jgi:hypothetical protein
MVVELPEQDAVEEKQHRLYILRKMQRERKSIKRSQGFRTMGSKRGSNNVHPNHQYA